MSTITVSIIAHNEAENIERCLNSATWADEVIVVDCASADETARIAKKYTEKVFYRENNPNLNVNKQFGFSKATSDWIFYLDPDEAIPPALAGEIRETLHVQNDFVGYFVKRKNHYFGKWLKFGAKYPDFQLRLFKREKGKFSQRHVHERLGVDGKIGYLHEPFEHWPYNTLTELMRKFDFYTSFEARYMSQQGMSTGAWNSFQFLVYKPVWRFIQRYIFKLGFLDGLPGFIACVFDALSFTIRYVKLWELEKRVKLRVDG